MVFYFTSTNVKLLRNISEDFTQCKNCTAYEYMKTYIEQCPVSVDDEKLKWIAETFLGTQKHGRFLRDVAAVVAKDLTPQDLDYFMTILYAIIFQIQPEEKEFVYKSLFTLSKELLQRFATFFCNNEMLPIVSQLACAYYDAKFVNEKIISPLFMWQPYISEISHDFESYLQRTHQRSIKPPTVPAEMIVLNRPTRSYQPPQRSPTPTTPTYQPPKKGRMLTKSDIDQRLKIISLQNKLRAEQLLNEVKRQDFSFAKDKSTNYYKKIAEIQDEIKKTTRPSSVYKKRLPVKMLMGVKDNVSSIKRISQTVAKVEKDEVQWMQNILKSCRNTAKIERIEEEDRIEKERDRQINIEKNRLMGQLSYEEAILAKQKVTEENKRKYDEFVKEKAILIEKLDEWKRQEAQKNKHAVEKMSFAELELIEAKNKVNVTNKCIAQNVKEKSKYLLSVALEEKNNELQRKVNMIKEIKVLALVARQARIPKIIDLTESSGLGFLCEMSIAELQERLCGIKIQLKEELQNKKLSIRSDKVNAKNELEETKSMIKQFLAERSSMRSKKIGKNENAGSGDKAVKNNKEIMELKRNLEEKRQIRQKMAAAKRNL